MIDLWWMPLTGETGAAHVGSLTAAERMRAAAYRRDADRQHFVAGRLGLRAVLATYADPLCTPGMVNLEDRHGLAPLPCVDRTPLPVAYSFSRAGAAGVVAVAPRGRLGVDLELNRALHDLNVLAEQVLAGPERAELATRAPDAAAATFLRYWTLKEALVKATTEGLGAPMRAICLSLAPAPRLIDGPDPYAPGGFALAEVPVPGFALALAWDGAASIDWQWRRAPSAA